MAPPANRRSGFSRRAQYSTFFSYTAGVIGAAVGLVLLVIAIASPGTFSALRGAASDVTEPAAQASAQGRGVAKSFVAEISGFFQTGRDRVRLEKELGEAKIRLVEAQAIKDENRRLKQLLDLAQGEDAQPIAFAPLVASTSASTRRFATVGAGADRGVAKGMPVRSPMGLVGRVMEVGASSSRVLLVTDTESLVPVRRARDGVAAFAQGQGDGTIRIRLINLGLNPLRKGDVMVTTGSGGLYQPGTPMAVVTRLLRDGAIARILSNPSDTDYVIIERAWAPPAPPPPAADAGNEEG